MCSKWQSTSNKDNTSVLDMTIQEKYHDLEKRINDLLIKNEKLELELKKNVSLAEEATVNLASETLKYDTEIESYQYLVAKAKSEIKELKYKLSKVKKQHNAEISSNIEQLKSSNKKISNLEQTLQKSTNENADLIKNESSDSKKDLETQIEILNSKLASKMDEVSDLKFQVNALIDKNMNLRKKFQEKGSESKKQMEKDSVDGNDRVSELEKARDELKIIVDTQIQEISALQFQLSSEQLQHDQIIKNYKAQSQDQSDLQIQVKEQEQLIENLVKQLMELKENTKKEVPHKENQGTTVYKGSTEKDDIIRSLQSDNKAMKKRLVKLIKEKDVLWQKADQLTFEQKQQAGEVWMDSSTVTNCIACKSEFSLFHRKYHCRVCGKIFCYNCSNNWMMTPSSRKKERVCNRCFKRHEMLEDAPLNSSVLSYTSSDSDEEN